jgi:Zn-finger domain-containing protein
MADVKQFLTDLHDLILTLKNNPNLLRESPELLTKWTAKHKKVQEIATQLTPEERETVEREHLEWLRREAPDLRVIKLDKPPKLLTNVEKPDSVVVSE